MEVSMGNSVEPRTPLLLVVDDDHKLVPLLERGLRYEGFGVVCAYSGTEALSAARSTAPDLVLLDVGMPDLDGFEVLRELRRHSDVPVVMLTSMASRYCASCAGTPTCRWSCSPRRTRCP